MRYYYPPVNFWSVWFSEMMLYFLKINNVDVRNSSEVLDVGCGLGNHCFSLLDYNPAGVTGFDISQETIQLLNEFHSSVVFRKIDICVDDITEYKNKFDIVFSGDVYEHVIDPNIMLQNIAYILKDDGCICITFPNEGNHGHNQIKDISVLKKQLFDAGFSNENMEVIEGPSGLYRIFTSFYMLLQKLSDKVFKIQRDDADRRPESDEFHEFYAYKKIQKIKDKKLLVNCINFMYSVMKKIARVSKPYAGHKDYRNIRDKRFILFARKQ